MFVQYITNGILKKIWVKELEGNCLGLYVGFGAPKRPLKINAGFFINQGEVYGSVEFLASKEGLWKRVC
jgi:hypothetical protein